MTIFKCKMCGGALEIIDNQTTAVCEYCGTQQTLPRLNDEKRASLYDRANHFRRNNEFDKAMSIYEHILSEDNTDAEAYWSLVLCCYGIEYAEDPGTRRRVPTINRAQFTSIFDDNNYKAAIQYADAIQRAIYESEAKTINEIQKKILAISQKEDPFDVFICYRESDSNGRRTMDSVLANDLYHQLTQEGFKVFFSRITLEDKLGIAYEPYIFAALNTAKIMVVLGTRPEHFQAVWVKNEWSRYLALVKRSGGKKVLIPAFRDMDPYDMPEEFSHLQAQDMSKLGFMQDLIRGIRKIIQADSTPVTIKETVILGNTSATPLLKRAFLYLEDGEWDSADEYCERVLDMEPENAQAYLGKLMVDLKVRQYSRLESCGEPFDENANYRKAQRFGDQRLQQELAGFNAAIRQRKKLAAMEAAYQNACGMMEKKTAEKYREALKALEELGDYKDAAAKAEECKGWLEDARKDKIYEDALQKERKDTEASLKAAAELFKKIPGWKDADQRRSQCLKKAGKKHKDAVYADAKAKMSGAKASDYPQIIQLWESIPGWKDADDQLRICKEKLEKLQARADHKKQEKTLPPQKAEKTTKGKKTAWILWALLAVCLLIGVLAVVLIPKDEASAPSSSSSTAPIQISLNKTKLSLEVGEEFVLVVSGYPADYDPEQISWKTGNDQVATVADGKVTALAPGRANITVNVAGKYETCTVTVTDPGAVVGISLDRETAALAVGATLQLVAKVEPEGASVTWNSSDPKVATVSEEGKVTAVSKGAATITASAGEYTAFCAVTVGAAGGDTTVAVTGVKLDTTSATLAPGESVQLTATVSPSNATDKTVTWTSSNTKVATVSGGKVTAVAAGTVTITATVGGKSATCTVTVKAASSGSTTVAVTSVSLNKSSASLTAGDTLQLTATVSPSNATNKTVTWTSSNTKVATVSGGKVTAVAAGTVTITATVGGQECHLRD